MIWNNELHDDTALETEMNVEDGLPVITARNNKNKSKNYRSARLNTQTQWDSRYRGLETEGSVHSNSPYDHEYSSLEWPQGKFSHDYQPFAVEWKEDAIEYAIHFAREKPKKH